MSKFVKRTYQETTVCFRLQEGWVKICVTTSVLYTLSMVTTWDLLFSKDQLGELGMGEEQANKHMHKNTIFTTTTALYILEFADELCKT